ncbi:organic hydroperoxide reductase OsmC/OhrA [Roseivirga ehrenbergii]|uniref:Peroxiredoxin n=1 Tax=Roseivirga ehrenbergii (strain DSM 102268 / JCM 13514 / KCTC 12282 / NCIMB 14502 / KMM 6017) TaxID=279360 RepID=A0A150XSN0_ROSEK|nr:OsmC family protein [Roseivirga ehrenbergii]KYG81696.1 peroxiredoxin [Roseivirga ehrenbergii]TCL10871.1 organic hydroperoxide reductase OsmC/OhrA [Roseivirga ehrenbergii]
MPKHHSYNVKIEWTGNKGTGTSSYRAYERSHSIQVEGKPEILGSSDPAFRGDNTKHNPEDMLVASLSACHMLFYLHLCADAGITVVDYVDNASGTMEETPNGGGRFTKVILRPTVTITDKNRTEEANQLHYKANELCFIANSCNFPVRHEPSCQVRE